MDWWITFIHFIKLNSLDLVRYISEIVNKRLRKNVLWYEFDPSITPKLWYKISYMVICISLSHKTDNKSLVEPICVIIYLFAFNGMTPVHRVIARPVSCLLLWINSGRTQSRADYFSNLACDWSRIVCDYSEEETENGLWLDD